MNQTGQFSQQHSANAIGDLFREIWAGRSFILAGLFLGFLAAFTFTLSVVPHSKAEITLAPANPLAVQRVTSSAATLSRRYQAEPVEENLGFTKFENSYKGVAVADLLLKNPEITEGLKQDKTFAFSVPKQSWTAEELAEYISQRVRIDPVGETSLRSFSYYHPDPEFAVAFLQRIHAVADGLLRRDMRVQIDNRIQYLNETMAGTYNPEHKRALADLLLEQQRMKMMVSIDNHYAANVVVPAAVRPHAQWPDVALVYTLFPLIGGLFGFFVFSVYTALRVHTVAHSHQSSAWFKTDSGNNNNVRAARPLTGKKTSALHLDDEDTPQKRTA